jgi:fumarylacetoacetase
MMDQTHDPALRSWVDSANEPDGDFPIQNLPLGVFRRRGEREPRIGVAIGSSILDLPAAREAGLLEGLDPQIQAACAEDSLRELMALGRDAARALRHAVSVLLRDTSRERGATQGCLVDMGEAELLLPARIGDYTDFYASIHHATNVGSMFRPDNPLLPNYKWMPIGYHGRASSIVVSGSAVRRPNGQTVEEPNGPPSFGPAKRLDYEMEVGALIGRGNALGTPIPLAQALDHLFGLCLVNDWSARDIQTWEYQPLGPFLAKSFATSISPWVVTVDALEPFRVPALLRADGDPGPLPHLDDRGDREWGAFDITVEVWLATAQMRERGLPATRLSRGRFRDLYWTLGQMVAHHTSNGCNLQPGDLIASGTVSGPEKEARGSLLELAWRGTEPIELPSGETRKFLADGDEVILRGDCQREGFRRIGFGECRGVVTAALAPSA